MDVVYNNLIFLFQGKLQVEERGAKGFSQPHNFVAHTFMPPSNCDLCYQMIIGILNRGKCVKTTVEHEMSKEMWLEDVLSDRHLL